MADAQQVLVIGGGHNGLVAATYLARAGPTVTVLEARGEVGGAVASGRPFPGVDANLSRFSYLVSLLPEEIVADLGLELELRSREVASYTPVGGSGVLVERQGPGTRDSFAALTGSDHEYEAWIQFDQLLHRFADAVAPTLTHPLPRAAILRDRVGTDDWAALVERPLGELIEARFDHDAVRGLVLTDALIGTFAGAHDPSLRQNRCFAYHVIGNGTGEWKVPVGGMGQVSAELARAARAAGVQIHTHAAVTAVHPRAAGGGDLTLADGSQLGAATVLVNCAPAVLQRLLGRATVSPSGSQLKLNLVLDRLPRLRSGLDPETAFGGTLHLNQGYGQLQAAYESAAAGRLPDPLPAEVYCHTLTDGSILGPTLRGTGAHTLTVFGLHTPAELFIADPAGARLRARDAALQSLQSVLAEPLEGCLTRDSDGRPCVEVMTPLDVEAEIGMPGGHIFHGDLTWPWLDDDAVAEHPTERWGVATDDPGILLCGSGSVRGGAVSGLGGHSAAMAVLEG